MWKLARRDLRCPREEELVALDPVDVDLVGRQEPRAVHRLLADEHGRQDGDEALRDHAVEREPVERELDQRRLAHAVGETRPGDPRARSRSIQPWGAEGRDGRAARSRTTAAHRPA